MGFFLPACPQCGETVPAGANFCLGRNGTCGAPVGDLRRVCPHCRTIVPLEVATCPHCGQTLEEVELRYALLRWARNPNEFARRLPVGDLHGALDGGVIVDTGTRVVVLVNGKVREILEPGWSSARDDRLRAYSGDEYLHTFEAVAFDKGPVTLPWEIPVTTSEGLRASAELSLVFSLAEPLAFLEHVLKGQNAYTLAELQKHLGREVTRALIELVKAQPAEGLQELGSGLLAAMEDGLRLSLSRVLAEAGLRLDRLAFLCIRSPRLEELRQDRDLNAYLEGKGQETTRRLDAIERLQKHLLRRQRIDDEFRREAVKSKVLTDAEVKALEDEIRRHQDDMEFAWNRTRQVLAAKHEAEVERIRAESQADVFVLGERRRIEVDRERELMKLHLRAQEQEVQRGWAEFQHRLELEKLREKAAAAKDLIRARGERVERVAAAVKGMGADQILAVVASDKPQVADALGKHLASLQDQLQQYKDEVKRLESLLARALEAGRPTIIPPVYPAWGPPPVSPPGQAPPA